MDQENFEYLKTQLKYAGFGENLQGALEAALRKSEPQFQLTFEKDINGKAFVALLNFRKSDQSERYYFNSYHGSLQRSNGEMVDQAFYLQHGKGITAKEAYNLLDGRAVYKELQNKEGQPYHAWLQLDFDKRDKHNNHEVKQYHEAYGYDLKAALSKYAITEMDGGEKEKQLLQSLQKGNLQSVGMEKEGTIGIMVVEANPQFKSINVYDGELKKVPREALEKFQHISSPGSESQLMQKEKRKENAPPTPSTGKSGEVVGKKEVEKAKGLLPRGEHPKTGKGPKIH